MKSQPAQLTWEVYVTCPHCEAQFDVASTDDHNELAARIFTNEWDALDGFETECPECGKEFEMGGIEY